MVRQCSFAGGQTAMKGKRVLLKVKRKSQNKIFFCKLKRKQDCHNSKIIDLQALSTFIWAELYNLLIDMSSLHIALISRFGQYNFNVTAQQVVSSLCVMLLFSRYFCQR